MKATGHLEKDGLDTVRIIDKKLFGLWSTRPTKEEADKEAKRIEVLFAPSQIKVRKYANKHSKGYAIYRRNGKD